ncbi:hypothetical protein Q9L58_009558 [Maublancomyces gigas]|uniref:Uncharacterized protein n=1 Tax=Discina gigas TaxID=1032678 RepID=A0ABR3G6K4_9PEZI
MALAPPTPLHTFLGGGRGRVFRGYDGLKKDVELWLIGSEGKVRVVVLICLQETPAYHSHRFVPASVGDDNKDSAPSPSARSTGKFPLGSPSHGNDNFELAMLDVFGWLERVPDGCVLEEKNVFDFTGDRDRGSAAVYEVEEAESGG